jgi:2-polyprenyl-6-methoxyphenol hydroxylase-like FAD-dependent oxidoreductase
LDLFAPDGSQIGEIPLPKVVGSDVPSGGGIMRPELGRILADATRTSGVAVRAGCTYEVINQADGRVEVSFTDGSNAQYDLVVGADGVNSRTRELLFPRIELPRYLGQCVWRAVLPRPSDVVRPRMWVGGAVKIGVNPVSHTRMYMFITEPRPERTHIDRELWPDYVARLIKPFPDHLLQEFLPHVLAADAAIDYRPLFNLLVPAPWNRGRVVMIGDTVAATTPHLAAGAGIGIESGIVLAEELARSAGLQAALDVFHRRRWERCRMVIENSERLCRIETEHGDMVEHARIMRESAIALTQPI